MSDVVEKMMILLQDICDTHGIEEFGFDEDCVCALEFRDQLLVNMGLHANGDDFLLYCALGEVPDAQRDELLTELLQANLFPIPAGAVTFAIHGRATVVLTARFPLLTLSIDTFQAAFEPYLDLAQMWQARLFNPNFFDTFQQTPQKVVEEPQEPQALPDMLNHMAFMIKG